MSVYEKKFLAFASLEVFATKDKIYFLSDNDYVNSCIAAIHKLQSFPLGNENQ